MRTTNPTAQALLDRLLAGEQIAIIHLVEVLLDTPLYLTDAGGPVVWGGHTWQSVGLRVDAVQHTAGTDIDQLAFVLPAVTEDQLAIGLEPEVEGKVVRVYDALVDPTTGTIADAILSWAGTLNIPSLEDGPSASVSWTAEHRAVQAMRPKPSRYTNDEQQRLYPGDTCLDFDPATDAQGLAWPSANYFKQ